MRDEDWEISMKHLRKLDPSKYGVVYRDLLNRLYDEVAELKKKAKKKP